jgi:hypothetical protein
MALPQFIELPGSSVYRHPFPLQGMNSQALLLHADYEQLKKTTDVWLNSVPGNDVHYVPLLPFVICNPVWINRISWTPAGQGWMRESDFNFAYYVACFKGREFQYIAIAQAYLVVDNPLTVSTGREVFGYRKVFGQMEYLAGTYQPIAASTWVLRDESPDAEMEIAEVARIIPPAGWPAATRKANWEDLKQLAEVAIGDLVFDAATGVMHLIEMFKAQNLPVVYLLQLRDVQFPESAAFQAILESPMQITHLHSAWFLPPGYKVQLTNFPSYPLISDLGLRVDANGVADVALGFQTYWDCVLQPGRVVAMAGRPTE